jgi:hypothetical protein
VYNFVVFSALDVLRCVQGSTLAGSLASLAMHLAAAVARLEAVTVQELQEDSFLKDGANNLAYLSRKLLECPALHGHSVVTEVIPANECVSRSTQQEASAPLCTQPVESVGTGGQLHV